MSATMERYWNVVDKNTQARELRDMINEGVIRHDYPINEMIANSRNQWQALAEGGGLRTLDFAEDVDISEMITTSDGSMDLLEKVRIDVAFGLAEIPLLYGPVFERINGPFPGGVFQIDENTLQADVVFLEKFEGGEVQFGTLRKGVPALGKIQTYAAGFEWTEDMVEFDQTWSIELHNRAFGRAYNALLNHLHLSPIIGYTYTAPNQTPANATGTTLQEKTHLTFQAAYTETVKATVQRRGTVLLASETNRFQIEDALLTPVRDVQGNPLATVPIDTIVYYDGESVVRGTDTIVYPGVTTGKCYLIFPKRKLKEMLHHDLRIDIGPADISRLVEGQQVGRARRGLYADIANSVEEITLPV
jgi:hypothetical protein